MRRSIPHDAAHLKTLAHIAVWPRTSKGNNIRGWIAVATYRSSIDGEILCPDSTVHPIGRCRAVGQQQLAREVGPTAEILHPARSPTMVCSPTSIVSWQPYDILSAKLVERCLKFVFYYIWRTQTHPVTIITASGPIGNRTGDTVHKTVRSVDKVRLRWEQFPSRGR